jgi:peptidoglycan/xylan/chitin deacetylase (PgdA/CDA1 family)
MARSPLGGVLVLRPVAEQQRRKQIGHAMNDLRFCFTVDDVGYDGYSSEEHLANLLAFCDRQGLKATLFAVPRCNGRELGERSGYVRLLRTAAEAGHEVAQHGLDHERFETGIPPAMVLELPHEGPAREHLATHRAEIAAALEVEPLRARLRQGRQILECALGRPIRGFRAPCLSTCANLFAALAAEGYGFDSSKCLQPTAWDIINGRPDTPPRPITRALFEALRADVGLPVYPLTAEYTWYLKDRDYEVTLRLARHDLDACLAAGIPFVSVCHVSPIQEGAGNRGFDAYTELLDYARSRARQERVACRSCTLGELECC